VLIFHGRADDMMILDGINIFPREIELTLESHPRVREAVAFPVLHPVHKDLPAALVVLSGASSEAELISFCRERIGVRAPSRITILPEIPEQFRGKVMRRDFFPLLREAGL
jgi:acyl-coenzyme A synthetase/AMP-(fatty) acid ligase